MSEPSRRFANICEIRYQIKKTSAKKVTRLKYEKADCCKGIKAQC